MWDARYSLSKGEICKNKEDDRLGESFASSYIDSEC